MRTRLQAVPGDASLVRGFARIREELRIPDRFPPAVLAEADAVVRRGAQVPPGTPTERRDARSLHLRAIDPPGSRDLDQAFGAERTDRDRYRVWYAIADLAAFVAPGGAIDEEARRRGLTQYGPDQRASLHPERLNEDAASLLPGQDRPALLWEIALDGSGAVADARLERAVVHVGEAISYDEAQTRLDQGSADEALSLLREIGERRLEQERQRGAVSLTLPAQEVVREADGAYALRYDVPLPVEGWNAQISLLAGMVAAGWMLDAGIGILRTLEPGSDDDMEQLRRSAMALGVSWPAAMSYPERARTLDPASPAEAAFMLRAARSLGGAGYRAFTTPEERPAEPRHAALAAPYAHVTAPLRRVGDRYANEVLLSVSAGRPVPTWASEMLPDIPAVLRAAATKERSYERAVIDYVEARLLADHIGETFRGMVVSKNKEMVGVQLTEPAVITEVPRHGLSVGHWVEVVLREADPATRRLRWDVSQS